MVQPTKFYTACIRNEVHQGFVADNVLLAGKAIGAMGNILENLGYLLTQFGWTGVVLSGAGLGAGTVWEAEKVQKLLASLVSEEPHIKDFVITPFATNQLKITGTALGAGLGLSVIAKPVTYIGNILQDRETLCSIGSGLTKQDL